MQFIACPDIRLFLRRVHCSLQIVCGHFLICLAWVHKRLPRSPEIPQNLSIFLFFSLSLLSPLSPLSLSLFILVFLYLPLPSSQVGIFFLNIHPSRGYPFVLSLLHENLFSPNESCSFPPHGDCERVSA